MSAACIPVPLVCLVGALQGSDVRESVIGANAPSEAHGSPDPTATGRGAGAAELPQGSRLGGVTARGGERGWG